MNYHDNYYTVTEKHKFDMEKCKECQESFHCFYYSESDNKTHLYEVVTTICKNNHYIDNKMYIN